MELQELMKLILKRYEGSLYNSALTKLIYLIDLESVKKTGEQVTDIHWLRDRYGPFVWDIIHCAEKNRSDFEVAPNQGINEEKKLILLKEVTDAELDTNLETLIDDVKNKVPNPNTDFFKFLDYVSDTIPMQVSLGGNELDIKAAVQAAKEVEALASELDTPEWNESFEYLATH